MPHHPDNGSAHRARLTSQPPSHARTHTRALAKRYAEALPHRGTAKNANDTATDQPAAETGVHPNITHALPSTTLKFKRSTLPSTGWSASRFLAELHGRAH